MSVLGYDLAACYPGRGPIEAASQGIRLADGDIAWRCNLVTVADGVLKDYSAGHIDKESSAALIRELQARLGGEKVSFHQGVSYRNLLVLHGAEFSDKVDYFKPDSSQDEPVSKLRLRPIDSSSEAARTVAFLENLMMDAEGILSSHLSTKAGKTRQLDLALESRQKASLRAVPMKYSGRRAAVISAVDVILGIANAPGWT
jgi:2,3-bisphosphoglycerate-independent phosphoglycerate mutase